MQYMGVVLVVAIIVIIVFLTGSAREKQQKKIRLNWLRESYGTQNDQSLTRDEIDHISMYHKSKESDKKDRFSIDEITWNDLGMDDIFVKMDTCCSAVGEEELYHRLHTPALAEDAGVIHFTRLMEYFDSHDDDRLKVQEILHSIGIYRKTSVTKIFEYVYGLEPESNMQHYTMAGLMLVSIALIFIMPAAGVLMLIVAAIASIGTYLVKKKAIDPVVVTFNYTARMLKACENFNKSGIEVLRDDIEKLIESSAPLVNIQRKAIWISSGTVSMDNPIMLLVEYIKMFFHVDLIMINRLIRQLKFHVNDIDRIRSIIGTIDASIAAGSYKRSLERSCVPQFVEGDKAVYEVRECVHPMLNEPVPNSISADGPILLTGSNASGKSTFLKTVTIAALMAQSLGYVPASSYRASRFMIFTSMALSDSIRNGESYFIVEIKSIKRIIDAGKEGVPVLCCIDEVLRGTNTIERIAASTQILKSLNRPDYITFAATHDIELTRILEGKYTNYHFDEEIEEDDVKFNYLLKTGRAHSRNAIKLLGVMDYDKKLISDAEQMVEEFTRTGEWGTA